jgi:integrase
MCRGLYQDAPRRLEQQETRQAMGSTLATYASPVFGKLPVAAVDVGLVLKVLEPDLEAEKRDGEPAARPASSPFSIGPRWHGYRTGENPARWGGHLDHLLPERSKVRKVEHHAALPYRELPTFMASLREQKGIAARALEFTILTAARTGETLGARWDEIDGDVWTVPEERMKGDRKHEVPLSPRALAMLEELRGTGEFVFPGARAGKPLSDRSLFKTLPRMGRDDLTTHGFRSTFRDWCGDHTEFPREVAEAALAHAIGDSTEAAYRRSDALDKRRKLMEAWGAVLRAGERAGRRQSC